MYDIAIKLAGLMAFGLIAVGILAIVSPRRLARSYGVEVNDAASFVWVRATGARDIIFGIMLGVATLIDETTVMIAFCGAGLLLSLADFALAMTFARRFRSEQVAHIGGAIAFIVILVLFMQTTGSVVRP